jgi:hypothetical protein
VIAVGFLQARGIHITRTISPGFQGGPAVRTFLAILF